MLYDYRSVAVAVPPQEGFVMQTTTVENILCVAVLPDVVLSRCWYSRMEPISIGMSA